MHPSVKHAGPSDGVVGRVYCNVAKRREQVIYIVV